MTTSMGEVQDFMKLRRIALVGLSRDSKHFSRMVFREMSNRGYDMVPVNPTTQELEGKRCFAQVQQIEPAVEGALIMTLPRETERVVRQCAAAGIRNVWMHRGGGEGAVSKEAVDFCRQHGIQVVEGHCPFMFLTHTSFLHRVHGFILKLTGGYPKAKAA